MPGFHGVIGSQDSGKIHHVTERLVAFEYISPNHPHEKPHSLVFIGGLGDGLCTVPYLKDLSAALEPTEWSLFSFILNSSYDTWGLGRLGQDVEDIAQCVEYITKYKEKKQAAEIETPPKIVVMGHSTGSQDVLYYLSSPNPLTRDTVFDKRLRHIQRPALDGAIMQAPVSDREGIIDGLTNDDGDFHDAEVQGIYLQLVEMAKTCTYSDGNAHDVILPVSLTCRLGYPPVPITARRFLSLISPEGAANPGEDDLFSSDLSDERLDETFGMIASRDLLKTKFLVLYSGDDEHVPKAVDKFTLLKRWEVATDKPSRKIWDEKHSGVIPGASHNIGGEGEALARRYLVDRVTGYLEEVRTSR